MVRLWGKKR